jgi:hypothetical protein
MAVMISKTGQSHAVPDGCIQISSLDASLAGTVHYDQWMFAAGQSGHYITRDVYTGEYISYIPEQSYYPQMVTGTNASTASVQYYGSISPLQANIMSMTPEAKVKKQVKAILDEFGVYYFSPQMGGYGSSGVPDLVGCYHGFFFAIECKAGNNTTTKLQDAQLHKIEARGGCTLVVNEVNIDSVRMLMKDLFIKHAVLDTALNPSTPSNGE